VIADTCVTCHMEKAKPPAALSNNFGGTNHTFKATAAVCTSCHTDVDGENLAAGFDDMLGTLKVAIQDRIAQVMREQIAKGYTIKVGNTTISDMGNVAKLEITAERNHQIIVTLTNGTKLPTTQITKVMVVKPSGAVTLYSVSGNDIGKAWWNYALLTFDASKGAHNPSWALEVINETLRVMGASYKGAAPITASDLVVGMR
jgi:formate-dependent nitrite reductase cytochrome c552 subunit